jgi:hypothetical protein
MGGRGLGRPAGYLVPRAEVKPSIEIGVVLVLGLFGMAVAAELMKLVHSTDWKTLLLSVFRRGGGTGG